MSSITAIVICKNEAHRLDRCLSALDFADEIVVFDSGSEDNSVEICRGYTDAVYVTDWPGYGQQKNRAIDKATKDWILQVDADEVVTPELAEQIKKVLALSEPKSAYSVPFQNYFCDRRVHFGAWGQSDVHVRLFQRQRGRYNERGVHEKLIVEGPVGRLRGALRHYTVHSFPQAILKMNTYALLAAQHRLARGRSQGFFKAFLSIGWDLLYNYILRGGFLDGRVGVSVAMLGVMGRFLKYTLNAEGRPF